MKYLAEVIKIVAGASNSNLDQVASYAEQLAVRLERDGDTRSAKSVRRALAGGKSLALKLSRASGNAIPVDAESRLPLADIAMLAPGDVQIYLDQEAANQVSRFLRFIKHSDELMERGVGIAPSLLLYGPPGCGKTHLAAFIASQLKLPLITARTDSLISSYLGSTSKNLRALFDSAMAQPCVLFLDEFDAVAKLRDDRHELGELKRVVVSLIQNLDALDHSTVLLAATNHSHLLDSAIWRRFAYKIAMQPPGQDNRMALFQDFLDSYSDEESIQFFSKISQGLTGADIRTISEDAKRQAIISGESRVSTKEIVKDVLRLRNPEHAGSSGVELISKARELDPDYFTIRRLAKIFGLSKSTVGRMLRRTGD